MRQVGANKCPFRYSARQPRRVNRQQDIWQRARALDLGTIRTSKFDFNLPLLVDRLHEEAERPLSLGDRLLSETYDITPRKMLVQQADRVRFIHAQGMRTAVQLADDYLKDRSLDMSADEEVSIVMKGYF